ncbi:hypothetical protein TNCV_526081 [Trichonephila clavipes]|nr:hypothetical protein TNCV_526081 [Trichonephila clavipes]
MYFSSYQINTANEILDALISVPPQDSSKSGVETKESVVNKMTVEMLEKLPAEYILHEQDSWLACHEFESSTIEDPPCREAMHEKSVENSNVIPLV